MFMNLLPLAPRFDEQRIGLAHIAARRDIEVIRVPARDAALRRSDTANVDEARVGQQLSQGYAIVHPVMHLAAAPKSTELQHRILRSKQPAHQPFTPRAE